MSTRFTRIDARPKTMMTILRMIALGSFLIALPLQAPANSLIMPGEVIKGHAKDEQDCVKCHKKFDKPAQCLTCHNARDWNTWDFDHNATGFRLDGAHQKIGRNCYACHMKPMDKKVLVTNACGACHEKDDVHNGTYGDRCERCHEGNDWKQIKVGVTTTRKN